MSDTVELDILEANELIFNVSVDGASVAPKIRMFLENKDVSYCFEGKPTTTPGNVSFLIPEGVMQEGQYPSRVEVIVGNKILVPMKFSTVFKGSMKPSMDIVEATTHEQHVDATVKMIPVRNLSSGIEQKRIIKAVKTEQPVVEEMVVQHQQSNVPSLDQIKEMLMSSVAEIKNELKHQQPVQTVKVEQLVRTDKNLESVQKPRNSLRDRWLSKKR